MQVSVAANTVCQLGESPLWCEQSQQLYFVDILSKHLFILQPDSGQLQQITLPFLTSAIALTSEKNTLLLISDEGIWLYHLPRQMLLEKLADFPQLQGQTRTNEAMVSPTGDLYFGTMSYSPATDETDKGRWYKLTHHDLQLQSIGLPVGISNTLCWYQDLLFFADSKQATIYRSADDMGSFTPCITLESGVPDGSTICAEGKLWNAQWGESCLRRYANISQQFDNDLTIPLPVIQPTSCVFGGQDLTTLYITSAQVGLIAPDAYQGNLLQVNCAGRGRLTHRFPLKGAAK